MFVFLSNFVWHFSQFAIGNGPSRVTKTFPQFGHLMVVIVGGIVFLSLAVRARMRRERGS